MGGAKAFGLAVLAACSGGGGGAKREPKPPEPGTVGCYWAGHLTATLAPMRGDATCIQSRPIEVDLATDAAGTELGLVIMVPPVASGKSADGIAVTVNGELTACPATIGIQWTTGMRSWSANFSVTQDAATRQVTGQGFAQMACTDETCHCEAQVSLDGTIVPRN